MLYEGNETREQDAELLISQLKIGNHNSSFYNLMI